MKIAVTGATGEMGGNVIKSAREKDIDIGLAVDREENTRMGLQIENDDNFEKLLESRNIDIIVDFTVPEASMKYLEAAKNTDTPIVIGTTGFSEEQLEEIREAGEEIPVLKASNFSPSVNVMKDLIREAAGKLESYDIEITETHHNRKRDSPSGTAKALLEELEKVRGGAEEVNGREGEAPREEGEIGLHARRAGDIKGVHEVLFAGGEEVLKIEHRNESRQVFSNGALKAAECLKDKESGYYSFSEVLK
jgi:4-hydroxy-tetrahydrodipicolinate reductase